MNTKKHVGIWIRVSTEDQARGESPENHERRARAYAEAKGWQVVEVYNLAGVSGKLVSDHPEARRMAEDVRRGRITGLIFSKLARLARNTRELLDYADFFRERQADLISIEEAIDTSTPAGRLFYTLLAAMAEWEREEIAGRVRASVPIRAQMGKKLGGEGPFGYHWIDGKLIPHPDEAPIRRRIYELFREHRRLQTVARLLNEAGYRTRKGKNFSYTTVNRLIQDPTAKGWRRANYSRQSEDGRYELKPREEWVWSEIEPIVSEELWEECNALLAERKRGKKPAKKVRHLFAGLVLCDDCGRKMYVPSNSPKYICGKCRRKLPTEDLEMIFAEQLRGFVLSPEAIASHIETADEELSGKKELLASLWRERERVLAESEKLYRLYLEDALSVESFGRKNKPVEERLRQLDEEIPRLQAETDVLSVNLLSKEEVVCEARDLASRWEGLSSSERRAIVESLVDEIRVGREEIAITLAYLPTLSGTAAKGPQSA